MNDVSHPAPQDTAPPPPESNAAVPSADGKPGRSSNPWRWTALSALAVLAVLIAAGAAWWRYQESVRTADREAMQRTFASIDRRVAALETAVAKPTAAPASQALAALEKRIAALEARQPEAADASHLVDLSQRFDKLAADVEALRRALPPEGTIVKLAAQAEEAIASARDLAARRRSQEATLLVLVQLRGALERGSPYEAELRAARQLAPADDAPFLDTLAASAKTGVATRRSLIESFPALADAALRATAAPEGTALWQRALREAMELVHLRRVDGNGDDTASVLGRTEALARRDDLAGAAAALADLKGSAAATVSSWVDAVKARSAAEKALTQLEADLEARSAQP